VNLRASAMASRAQRALRNRNVATNSAHDSRLGKAANRQADM
jgi:hypothetical protein